MNKCAVGYRSAQSKVAYKPKKKKLFPPVQFINPTLRNYFYSCSILLIELMHTIKPERLVNQSLLCSRTLSHHTKKNT